MLKKFFNTIVEILLDFPALISESRSPIITVLFLSKLLLSNHFLITLDFSNETLVNLIANIYI